MIVLAFIATLLGTGLLCFAMRQHEAILFRSRLSDVVRLGIRSVAVISLVASSVLSSMVYGPFIGLTTFFAFLTLAILMLAFSLTLLK